MELHDLIPNGTIVWRELAFWGTTPIAATFNKEDRTDALRIHYGSNFMFEPTTGFCKVGLVAFTERELSPLWNSIVVKRYTRNNRAVIVEEGPKVGNGNEDFLRFRERAANRFVKSMNESNEEKFKTVCAELLTLNRVFVHQEWKPGNRAMLCRFVKFDGWK